MDHSSIPVPVMVCVYVCVCLNGALTLLTDIGGRATGEWQTVPPKTERVLFDAPVDRADVAFS